MARIYADENHDIRVIGELRQRGHDVLTAQEAGNPGQGIPDLDVLAFAVSRDRAVLSGCAGSYDENRDRPVAPGQSVFR